MPGVPPVPSVASDVTALLRKACDDDEATYGERFGAPGGAAALASVGPAQAATWLPGVSVSDETRGDRRRPGDLRLVVDADGTATAIWAMDQPGIPRVVQIAARAAGATDFGPVHDLGDGEEPDLVAHPDGSVTAAWEAAADAVDGDAAGGCHRVRQRRPDPRSRERRASSEPRLTVDGLGNVTMAFRGRPRRSVDDLVTPCRACGRAPSPVPSAGRVGGLRRRGGGRRDGYASRGRRSICGRGPGRAVVEPLAGGSLGEAELVDDARSDPRHPRPRRQRGGGDRAELDRATRRASTPGVRCVPRPTMSSPTRRRPLRRRRVGNDVALVVDDAGRVSGGWASATQGVVGVTRDDRRDGDHDPAQRGRPATRSRSTPSSTRTARSPWPGTRQVGSVLRRRVAASGDGNVRDSGSSSPTHRRPRRRSRRWASPHRVT